MQTSLLYHVSTLMALLVTAVAVRAQSSTGLIGGRVFNAATNRALVDAHVMIDGGKRETVNDQFGAYHQAGVPAGEARLSVSNVGLETQTATLAVIAGAATTRDFALALASPGRKPAADEVVKLTAFTVVADREMTDEKRRRLAGVLDKLNNRGRNAVVQHRHQLGAKKE